MVSTRRTRSRSGDVATGVSTATATANVPSSPRKTRSTRSRVGSMPAAKPHAASERENVELPVESSNVPRKRGRPPKRTQKKEVAAIVDPSSNEQIATPMRVPLANLAQSEVKVASGDTSMARLSPYKDSKTLKTPAKTAPKSKLSTPRLLVYESPGGVNVGNDEGNTGSNSKMLSSVSKIHLAENQVEIDELPIEAETVRVASPLTADLERSAPEAYTTVCEDRKLLKSEVPLQPPDVELEFGTTEDRPALSSGLKKREPASELATDSIILESPMKPFSDITLSGSPKIATFAAPQPSPVKSHRSPTSDLRTPGSQRLSVGVSGEMHFLSKTPGSTSKKLPTGEAFMQSGSSPIKSLRSSPNISTPLNIQLPASARPSPSASIKAFLPHPSLSFSTPRSSQLPGTPTTPTTTWIEGVEVPLPPDEWSPEKLQHSGAHVVSFPNRAAEASEEGEQRMKSILEDTRLFEVSCSPEAVQNIRREGLENELIPSTQVRITSTDEPLATMNELSVGGSSMEKEISHEASDPNTLAAEETSELEKDQTSSEPKIAALEEVNQSSPASIPKENSSAVAHSQLCDDTEILVSNCSDPVDEWCTAKADERRVTFAENLTLTNPSVAVAFINSDGAAIDHTAPAEMQVHETESFRQQQVVVLADDSLVEAIELDLDIVAPKSDVEHYTGTDLLLSLRHSEQACRKEIPSAQTRETEESEDNHELCRPIEVYDIGDVAITASAEEPQAAQDLPESPRSATILSEDFNSSTAEPNLPDVYDEVSPDVLRHVDEVEKLEAQLSESPPAEDKESPRPLDIKDDDLDRRLIMSPTIVSTLRIAEDIHDLASGLPHSSANLPQPELLQSSQDESLPSLSQLLGTSPLHLSAHLQSTDRSDDDITFSPIKPEILCINYSETIAPTEDSMEENRVMSPINMDRVEHLIPSESPSDQLPRKEPVVVGQTCMFLSDAAQTELESPLQLSPSAGAYALTQVVDAETSSKKQKKSSSRRQSRRQSYMTATKSAVREREMELRQQEQNEADLLLSTELEPVESLLEEMPGSVERKRTKRRSNSASRRSPLYQPADQPRQTRSRTSIEAEALSPVNLNHLPVASVGLAASAIKIQALFRGWKERKNIAQKSIDDYDQSSTETVPTFCAQQSESIAQTKPGTSPEPRPVPKEHDINDVFTDFLSKWQSKKSQKVKVDEPLSDQSPTKDNSSSTPRRLPAGTHSPQKNEKKVILAPVNSSAQKPLRQPSSSGRIVRSRLPAPRALSQTASVPVSALTGDSKSAGEKIPDSTRGIPVAIGSSLASQLASPTKISADSSNSVSEKKRKENESALNLNQRKRSKYSSQSANPPTLPVSVPVRSKTPPSLATNRAVTPVTPKRLLYLTPAEVTKTTRSFTSQNRLYRCDFDRVVVKKEIPRPPSPTAKIQAKMASNARTKRRRLMKEKGYTFGAGDEDDYVPKRVTPDRKAVKWGDALEVDLQTLPRTSPSKVRGVHEVLPCIAPSNLDDYGNLEDSTPLTPEIGKAPKVMITKYLYRGEQDD